MTRLIFLSAILIIDNRNKTLLPNLRIHTIIGGSFTYSYTPFIKPFVPLKGLKSKSKHLKFLKEWEFNYLPNNIAFNTNMSRYYYEQQIRDVSGSGRNGIADKCK